jgi:hypothetical protein
MDPLLLAFIGYILGALGRTFYDFLFKLLEDKTIKWDQTYTVTMLISIILTFISAAVTFPLGIVLPDNPIVILLTTAPMGFTVNHLVNKPAAYLAEQRSS